jgi:hypothetical protein
VAEFWQALGQLLTSVGNLLEGLGPYLAGIVLLVVWIAWWLWGVNWSRAWPFLAQGAWVPLVLLVIVAALVWSEIAPLPMLNFWAHLGGVTGLVLLALFCGWLQGVMHWTPTEMALEPPADHHDHGHGHAAPEETHHVGPTV